MQIYLDNMPVLRRFVRNINCECYANWRSGKIKNGGCIVKWNGHIIASIYAIVSVDRELVLVNRKGFMSRFLEADMKMKLYEYLEAEDPNYIRCWNAIDTPIRGE